MAPERGDEKEDESEKEDRVSRRDLERQIQDLRREKVRLEESIKQMDRAQERIFSSEKRPGRPTPADEEDASKQKRSKRGGDDEGEKEEREEEKDDKPDAGKKGAEDGGDKGSEKGGGGEAEEKRAGEKRGEGSDNGSDKEDRGADKEKAKDKEKDDDTRPTGSAKGRPDRRSRQIFGGLLGHLHAAKSRLEQERGDPKSQLRQKAEEKLQEKIQLSKVNIKEFRKAEFEKQKVEQQEKCKDILKQIEEKELLLLQKRLEEHYGLMMNFIRTQAEPTIFYLPASHNDKTKAQLAETRTAIKHKISSLKGQLQPPDEEQLAAELRERAARNSAAEAAMAAAEGAAPPPAEDGGGEGRGVDGEAEPKRRGRGDGDEAEEAPKEGSEADPEDFSDADSKAEPENKGAEDSEGEPSAKKRKTDGDVNADDEKAIFSEMSEEAVTMDGLDCVRHLKVKGSSAVLTIAEDSVVKCTAGAIVNAANEGCLGGGGIDGVIVKLGGGALAAARRALPVLTAEPDGPRCRTGDAKLTPAGDLPCEFVIHAVGPNFRNYPDQKEAMTLLVSAYRSSMERAREKGVKKVAFCMLSAGIFRGACPLHDIVEAGLMTIAKHVYPGLERVYLCAFTDQEKEELRDIVSAMKLP